MSRRQRTVTARRTTTEEVTVTETVDTAPVAFAPGWDTGLGLTQGEWLHQRHGQVERCLGLLDLWDASSGPEAEPPESLIRDAVTVLRAGPGATPMEQRLGRS